MPDGLPVSRLINVQVNLAPLAAQAPNLNSMLIVGDSDVIDTDTRVVAFSRIEDVADLFGTSAPEYQAAVLWFSQAPSPTQLLIGRWAYAATSGRLFGGLLSASQKLLTNFTGVTNGGFKIVLDGGAAVNVSGINLAGVTNLNGVASTISDALTSASVPAFVTYDGSRFVFTSTSTGTSSSVAQLQAPTSGTNLAPLMNGTLALGARAVQGVAAETALAAVTKIDSAPSSFYGLSFASTHIVDADRLAVAAYVEAASRKHIFGITTQDTTALDPTNTTNIGYLIKAAGYLRTAVQYSSSSPYAVASLFGRILTTNFEANRSMITLMFKQEPGVTAELLTTQQANALQANNVNVFVRYDNSTAIIQYGTVGSGVYFDEVIGTDWLRYRIQNDLFNALYTSPTKIPQTDRGNAMLATVIEGACAAGANNGLIGPGVWTSGGFGQLKTGDYMPSGFYVYAPPTGDQSVSDRAARKSVAFQVAAKLAGAIHTVDVQVQVNR